MKWSESQASPILLCKQAEIDNQHNQHNHHNQNKGEKRNISTAQASETSGGTSAPDAKRKGKKGEKIEKIIKWLLVYKGIHSDMLVPYQFDIPSNTSEWPEEVWGMKLGDIVNNIRNKGYYNEHHDELIEMVFDFASQRRSNPRRSD